MSRINTKTGKRIGAPIGTRRPREEGRERLTETFPVALTLSQRAWLDTEATARRVSRGWLIREALKEFQEKSLRNES